MNKNPFRLRAIPLFLLASGVAAQTQNQALNDATPTLAPVTVTANPLGSDAPIAPVVQYFGTELLLRQRATLGETLDGAPGVSSTYFGPNASRPVIRGLDGDRIRILSNGAASGDVSGLSYDHAVALDPLAVERVEVLRGPGALQYGGSAVGGVVNVIDNRIAREAQFGAGGGLSGRADVGLATGNREQSGAALLETGTDRYALHVDGFTRNTGDVSVPLALDCTRGGVMSTGRRICNSASESWGGAVGGSMFFDRGYLGASLSGQGSNYGTAAEDEVQIRMQSGRLALEGELRNPLPGWQSLRAQYSQSDYQHAEVDAGVMGTLFRTRGEEFRLQGRHARLGALDGVIGLHAEWSKFSADGAEAFAPYSTSEQLALFAVEELQRSWGKISAGARVESHTVASLGNPQIDRFVPARRSFNPASLSLGAQWKLAPAWQVNTSLSQTERAPRDYELFADGVHVATHAYETGNAQLGLERSTNLDLGLSWKQGADTAGVQFFVHEFSNYLLLAATGARRTVDGEDFAEYRYSGVQARLTGWEANSKLRLLARGGTLDLALRADTVRADNLSQGEPLPRIAPLRLGATLLWAQGPWGGRLGVDQWAAQERVPTDQQATPGYTFWNAALTYTQRVGGLRRFWYARIDNLGNRLGYSASSILTQTAPGRVPLPGQSLKVGLQVQF